MSKFQQRLKEYKEMLSKPNHNIGRHIWKPSNNYNVLPRRRQWYKRTMTPIKTKNYE